MTVVAQAARPSMARIQAAAKSAAEGDEYEVYAVAVEHAMGDLMLACGLALPALILDRWWLTYPLAAISSVMVVLNLFHTVAVVVSGRAAGVKTGGWMVAATAVQLGGDVLCAIVAALVWTAAFT